MQAYKRITVLFLILLVAIMALTSCATAPTKPDKPMSPKQQAAVWMNIYNVQYDDTMSMANNPNATPAQKAMVAKKKAILMKVWPLLKSYARITDTGGTPSASEEQAIINLINELTTLAGGA